MCPPKDLAAILLYTDDGRILLQHRTDDAPTFPGHWSFFGGSLEPGETPEEAVRREALEELSYRLKAPRLVWIQEFTSEDRRYIQHGFVERYDGSDLVLGEGQGMAWFRPSETKPLLMSPHTRALIGALKLPVVADQALPMGLGPARLR